VLRSVNRARGTRIREIGVPMQEFASVHASLSNHAASNATSSTATSTGKAVPWHWLSGGI